MHYLSNELQRQSSQLNDLSETFFIVRKQEGMAGEEAHFGLSNSPSLKSEGPHFLSDVLQPLWVAASSPVFHGANSLLTFESTTSTGSTEEATAEVDYDGCSFLQPAGKKRRLTAHQVQLLERSFEEDNKLEPERKVQLAKEIGLLPRQVAIWFQNRRARYKTKHMEKEYGALKANYDILKAGYHKLVTETEKLKQEVMCLKERLQIREERTEPVQAVDSGDDHKPVPSSEKLSSNVLPSQQRQIASECNQDEAASSARSDVLDSDSPYFTEANYLTRVEPANSSHVLEPEYSNFSQEEGEDIYLLPIKQASSMDQNFWCWPY